MEFIKGDEKFYPYLVELKLPPSALPIFWRQWFYPYLVELKPRRMSFLGIPSILLFYPYLVELKHPAIQLFSIDCLKSFILT